ncbi:MAG: hypothetical protein HQ518_24700 [Rhodopirellula sp.]|nr:hypothetical protein [Rhodopirellula sp.]
MTADEDTTVGNDLDGFRPVIPANRYYLNHMLKHVERCIDAVDQWLVDRKSKRGEVMAQLASEKRVSEKRVSEKWVSEERASVPVFDLPELWLPASVVGYLPKPTHELTLAAIHADVEAARSNCEAIDSSQKRHELILETEEKVATLVRVYVRPYEQLRLEIWTRLQQLDLFDLRKGADVPADLITLPNALTIEQMIDQSFSADPKSRIDTFTIAGPLGLTANLVFRTVKRKGINDAQADFGSTQAAWLPFIISFFAGRNGAFPEEAEKLYDQASKNPSDNSKSRARARSKAIAAANHKLMNLKVSVTTNWGLKSVSKP